jgi:hypothetical protein
MSSVTLMLRKRRIFLAPWGLLVPILTLVIGVT